MIFTSYFGNIKNIPSSIIPVSIAQNSPRWYKGVEEKRLAPTTAIRQNYRKTNSQVEYTLAFNVMLEFLDMDSILESLTSYGKDICLLCYEKPGEFCHRRLVAEYLKRAKGLLIPEYTKMVT